MQRIHLALRPDFLARVQRAADDAGISPAEWLRHAVVMQLRVSA